MNQEREKYIISNDVIGLTGKWCNRNGFLMPAKDKIEGIEDDLRKTMIDLLNVDVETVSEKEIRDGMYNQIQKSRYPVISLDRAYIDETPKIFSFIDSTRAVDENLMDIGLFARNGQLELKKQIKIISNSLKSKKLSDISLVDDVIFSGKGIIDIVNLFKENEIDVRNVFTGIVIEQGILGLEKKGIEVSFVKKYKDVIDEVCQRDFFAGVPLSGRLVVSSTGENWSAPYFLPFGKPTEWASIPDSCATSFSDYCIEQSIYLWSKIEKESKREVPLEILPRRLNLNELNNGISIVKALSTISLSRKTN